FTATFVNQAVCKAANMTAQEIVGGSVLRFIGEDHIEGVEKALRTVSPGNPVIEHINVNRFADGSTRWIRWVNRGIFNDRGEVVEYQGVGRDITEQKKAEDEVAVYRERLEDLVKERTRELEEKTYILEELNAATRVLLRQREEDRKELEGRFVANMKNLILPYAEKLKSTRLDERQKSYLAIMETHLDEILSPLVKTMQRHNLTPTESQVASLIKDGKPTKEIAAILGVAPSSIDTHRKSIRKKLDLKNSKVNLQSHLRAIDI
ncbi:MAG: LuxR C-terminal-related transcriptional regulator, partial [Syntrophales bacterium]|nr:LuxR C-terminal-related transcriptional regulator [Syntrophales bacterium]